MQNLSQKEETILALPALTQISKSDNLGQYFNNKIDPMKSLSHNHIENKILINAMVTEIQRLYGDDIALQSKNQLEALPIVETGTHLAIMRDYDNLQKDDLRASLNQNTIISAALLNSVGGNIHIGSYGSNVSLNHAFGGGYFQIGDELFQTVSTKMLNSNILYNAPSISDEYFNPNVLLIAKLSGLKDLLSEVDNPQEAALLKCVSELLAPINKNKTNFASFEKNYDKLKSVKKILINKAFVQLNAKQKEKTGISFSDMEKQYEQLDAVFSRKELSLSDQIALIQSKQLNTIVKYNGIEHVSIDALRVVKNFLIEALRDENSLWAKIFNDKELSQKFHQAFTDVRSSWKNDESVFDLLRVDNKGYTQTKSLAYGATDVNAKSLAKLLEEDNIVPSTALTVLIHQSADMLIHGGFFQSTYAKKIQNNFTKFLIENNFSTYAENVSKIPSDIMLLSLSVAQKDGKPMKISQISRLTSENKKMLMANIVNHSSQLAIDKSILQVHKYLEQTAPGYVRSEASVNIQKQHDKNKVFELMKNKIRRVSGE